MLVLLLRPLRAACLFVVTVGGFEIFALGTWAGIARLRTVAPRSPSGTGTPLREASIPCCLETPETLPLAPR